MRRNWKSQDKGVAASLLPIVSTLAGLVLIGALLAYFAEWHDGHQYTLWDSVWWTVVTMTTVGYGDIVPHTVLGRVVGMFVMLAGISVISLLTATISSTFVAQRIRESQGLRQTKLRGHTIICGWNERLDGLLDVLNRNAVDGKDSVVLVNEMSPERMEEVLSGYPNLALKYVHGDYTRELTLNRASVKDAKAVIIVPDMSLTSVPRDEKTLPAALAIKSIKRDLKVFAHIIDKENFSHLRRANVDDIIVSDDHVGYLLASDVSSPGIAQTVSTLLTADGGTRIQRIKVPGEFVGKSFKELQEHFKVSRNSLTIGFVVEEESVKLSDILSSDYSAIDAFIERKFKAAGLDMLEKGGVRLNLNPPLDYVIHEKEDAIVIG